MRKVGGCLNGVVRHGNGSNGRRSCNHCYCRYYLRGITNFDINTAYQAARKAATQEENNLLRPGMKYYNSLGWIPEKVEDGVWGTVSSTLEYNLSDWNLSQLAKALGKRDDYQFLETVLYPTAIILMILLRCCALKCLMVLG